MKNEETKEKKVEDMTLVYLKLLVPEDLKVIELMGESARGICEEFWNCFPTYRNETTQKTELHLLCGILKRIQAKSFREEITSESSVDSVLGVFLWCLCRFVSPRCFRVFAIFFRALREFLNTRAYGLLDGFKAAQAAASAHGHQAHHIDVTLKKTGMGKNAQIVSKTQLPHFAPLKVAIPGTS